MKNVMGNATVTYEKETKALGFTDLNFNFDDFDFSMEDYYSDNPILGVIGQYVDFYSGNPEQDRKVNQLILDNTRYDKENDLFVAEVPILKNVDDYTGLFQIGGFERPLSGKGSLYWLRIEFEFCKKISANKDVLETQKIEEL